MLKINFIIIFMLTSSIANADIVEIPEEYKNAKDINESPRMQAILRNIFKDWDVTPQETLDEAGKTPMIIGGNEAARGQIPHQVLLYMGYPNNEVYTCGGSVISIDLVLTAAHCVYGDISYINVYFGIANRAGPATWLKTASKSDVIIHQNYNDKNLWNDIALIKIKDPPSNLFQGGNTGVVYLPTNYSTNNFVGYSSRVSGFGRYSDSINATSPVLKYVDLPIITNSECSRLYVAGAVRDTNICQGTRVDASHCSGDSGGPLTITINGNTIIIGIVSFGASKGCELGYPGGFTRVTSYLNWIEKNSSATSVIFNIFLCISAQILLIIFKS